MGEVKRPVTIGHTALIDLQRDLAMGRPVPPRYLTRREVEPLLSSYGITRVADQTDLDRIGVPVWSAIRPASRGLSVATGKGVNHDAAWLSAVFESIEQAFAEDASACCSIIDSMAGMERKGLRIVPLSRQPRCAPNLLTPDIKLAWVRGLSLNSGEEIYAPYNLVGMDMAAESPWNPSPFLMSSNGLAAGGNIAGAVLHGLRELVEDEALMLAKHFSRWRASSESKVDFSCGKNHPLANISRKLARIGVHPLFAVPNTNIDVPTVVAMLSPADETVMCPQFAGVSCHDRLEDAALAALLEAIQTRLTFVAGSREDLLEDEYKFEVSRNTRGFLPARFRASGSNDFRSRKNSGGELGRLIGALRASGIDGIYLFSLGGTPGKFEVVRVLADDLMSVERFPGTPMPKTATRRIFDGIIAP